MYQPQLRPLWKRTFIRTTDSKHQMPVADNILNRQFGVIEADVAWVSDITSICTKQGWLYLVRVLGLYSRKIVGWACAPNMQTSLIAQALIMAIQLRQPGLGLVLHSDRGS